MKYLKHQAFGEFAIKVPHSHKVNTETGFTTVYDPDTMEKVKLFIDLEAIVNQIGVCAMRSKSGRAKYMHGAISHRRMENKTLQYSNRLCTNVQMIPGKSSNIQIYSAQTPAFPGISLAGYPFLKNNASFLALKHFVTKTGPGMQSNGALSVAMGKPLASRLTLESHRSVSNLTNSSKRKLGPQGSTIAQMAYVGAPNGRVNLIGGYPRGQQTSSAPVMAISESNEQKCGENQGRKASPPSHLNQEKITQTLKRVEQDPGLLVLCAYCYPPEGPIAEPPSLPMSREEYLEVAATDEVREIGGSMTNNEKVLSLDLNKLTDADVIWLHRLKNLAQAMTGRIQLKKLIEDEAAA